MAQYVDIVITLDSDAEMNRWFAFKGEEQIERALAGIGTLPDAGYGFGQRDMTLEGEDADALFVVVAPILEAFKPRPGSFAVKRYGEWDDEDVKERRVELGGP